VKLEWDRKADALYIYLSDKAYASGKDLDDLRRIDYDSDGNPRGIELLRVSKGVDLSDLPFRNKIERLLKDNDKIKIYA
jgi:uncharacterized protein YuzE